MEIKEVNQENFEMPKKKFEMPECEFCATCGTCMYYQKYGVDKAYCNYHQRSTSSSNPACGSYA